MDLGKRDSRGVGVVVLAIRGMVEPRVCCNQRCISNISVASDPPMDSEQVVVVYVVVESDARWIYGREKLGVCADAQHHWGVSAK